MRGKEVTNTSLTPTITRAERAGKRTKYIEIFDADLSLYDVVKKALRHKVAVVSVAMGVMSVLFMVYAVVGTWYQSEVLVSYNNFENSSLFQYIDKILPAGDDDKTDNRDAYVSRAVSSLNSTEFSGFVIEQSKENEALRKIIGLAPMATNSPENVSKVRSFMSKSVKFVQESGKFLRFKGAGFFVIEYKNFNEQQVQKLMDVFTPLIVDFIAKKEIADIQSIRQLVKEKMLSTQNEVGILNEKKARLIMSTPTAAYDTYTNIFSSLQNVKAMIAGNQTLRIRFQGLIREIEKNLFEVDNEKMGRKELNIVRSEVSGLLYQQQYGEIQGMDAESSRMKRLEEQLTNATARLKDLLGKQRAIADSTGTAASEYEEEYSLAEKIDSVEDLKNQNAYFQAKAVALEQVLKDIKKDINDSLIAEVQIRELSKLTDGKEALVANLEKGMLQLDLADFKTLKRQEIFPNVVSERNAMPFPTFTVLTLISGLLMGIIAGFALERKNPSLASTESFEELGMPVLGNIPNVEKGLLSGIDISAGDGHFLSLCYTRLGINLLNNLAYVNSQITLFTSDSNAKVSAVSALNTATYFARTGKRVLLIEADMKNNLLSKLTGAMPIGGLNEVCGSTKEINIKPVEIEGNLHLLNGDGAQLSSLYRLASNSFLELLSELKKEYELIFIHTEACLLGPDAADLSRYAGVTLVCCNAPQIKISTLERITSELKMFLSKNLYFVLESPDDIAESGYLTKTSLVSFGRKPKKVPDAHQKAA